MEEIMIGNWESIACEVRPQPNQDGTMGEWWLTRKLTLADGRIDAEFTTYAGPGCGFALQRLDFGGQVEIVGDSDVVAGAVEADLTIDDYVRITPLSDGFVEFLNSAPAGTCGETSWSVGETQDILETGCSVLGLQGNDPTVEYEVLAVQDGYIYFGARPTDGSFITSANKRPQALLVPAKRIEE
ncbi:MAG: hypothetical protein AAGA88_05560 [Pseudomonadota bacterium]